MANEVTNEALLYFNGINGASGEYGLPPLTGEALVKFIQGQALPENLAELRFRQQQASQQHLGVKEGVDAQDLAQTGWGVIFAHDADPVIKEALSELLDLRREQAGPYFKIYEGTAGYRPGESKSKFLARHGAGPGPVDPERVPYYLLIVGDPATIPYPFQYQLDVQYAVGRIYFDTPEAYANYARSVVQAETGAVKLPRRLSLFSVANPDDQATHLSTTHLFEPLFEKLKVSRPNWELNAFFRDEATKAQLSRLLGGEQTPALLFTGSHGMEFPPADPRQLPHQGALLCQDWPGPTTWRGHGPIPQEFYFAGDDLSEQTSLLGLLTFHFACYGLGTPLDDEFSRQAFKTRQAIASRPFVAGLPMRLLGQARGGALAAVGHVERTWGYSFVWPGVGQQTTVFESTLARLLDGYPVGAAMEYFNERYAELASDLSMELEEIEYGKQVNPYELAGMWTANNDARSYVVNGDPAVRLPVAKPGETPLARPVIKLRPMTASPAQAAKPAPAGLEAGTDKPFSFSASAQVDEVYFSAYHPRAIGPGDWHKLLVYAHLATALEQIATDARQILGKATTDYRQRQTKASTTLAPGTEITLVPQAQGLEFRPPHARLVWAGEWQRVDFEMRATGERAGHVVQGSIACYVGPLLVADLRLPIVVTSPDEPDEAIPVSPEVQSVKMYQAIFASYSHADTAIVEAMENAYKALGMDYLRDVMTLKSGQSWSDQLLSMVEQADIFQLFWSDPASQSAYVEQEWRYALNLLDQKGPTFIRPVYWQKPMPPVPEALSRLHFAPLDFASPVAPAQPARREPVKVVSVEPAIPAGSPPVVPPSLAALLPTAAEELKTLTISTYTAADLTQPDQARLKAKTRFSFSGDVEVYLPEVITAEDERYLELHQAMVKEAIQARLAYLKLISQVMAGHSPDTKESA